MAAFHIAGILPCGVYAVRTHRVTPHFHRACAFACAFVCPSIFLHACMHVAWCAHTENCHWCRACDDIVCVHKHAHILYTCNSRVVVYIRIAKLQHTCVCTQILTFCKSRARMRESWPRLGKPPVWVSYARAFTVCANGYVMCVYVCGTFCSARLIMRLCERARGAITCLLCVCNVCFVLRVLCGCDAMNGDGARSDVMMVGFSECGNV